jgi:tetratricopeptide (TPR) repeat protein
MNGKRLLQEGKILFASGQPEKSIPLFTSALEHGADPLMVGLSRGAANMALQCYPEAKKDFTLAIDTDPENERAYYYRGIAEIALGEYREAVEDLTRSLARCHNRGIAYLARGLAYAELGEERDARLDFNSASAFSEAELQSFLRVFDNHPAQRRRSMEMLKRQGAPWKALLTETDAEKLRKNL